MADALMRRPRHEQQLVLDAAIASGEIYQLNDGRAGVYCGLNTGAIGDTVGFITEGRFLATKTATQVWLEGAPIWWDHSANSATCVPPFAGTDRDFYLGTAEADVASAVTTGVVNLNVQPVYEIDFQRDGGDTVVVLTAGTPTIVQRGGSLTAAFSATAEAQKLDWISKRGVSVSTPCILEAVAEVVTDADADVVDCVIGLANATHASDADSITEAALFKFNLTGAEANIYAESDDGTTEVAATDTTLDWVLGTPVHLVLDARDLTDVRYYVNGVEVLNGTADLGDIRLAAGPLKALFHLEKSSNDSPGAVSIDMLRVRTMQQPE